MKKLPENGAEIMPLVVIFEPGDGTTHCQISRLHDYDYREYGLIVCDLVRHVAKAFDVHEDEVWEWVQMERTKPTTKITGKIYT